MWSANSYVDFSVVKACFGIVGCMADIWHFLWECTVTDWKETPQVEQPCVICCYCYFSFRLTDLLKVWLCLQKENSVAYWDQDFLHPGRSFCYRRPTTSVRPLKGTQSTNASQVKSSPTGPCSDLPADSNETVLGTIIWLCIVGIKCPSRVISLPW